jgi:hypothetical protein
MSGTRSTTPAAERRGGVALAHRGRAAAEPRHARPTGDGPGAVPPTGRGEGVLQREDGSRDKNARPQGVKSPAATLGERNDGR